MNKIFHAANEKLQHAPGLTNYQEICQCFFFQFVKKQSFFIGSKTQKNLETATTKKDQLMMI